MNILEFTLLVLLCSFLAGFLGSLTGLGGGVVIVPLLALVFGVNVRYAIGASLVSVIATSSGAKVWSDQRVEKIIGDLLRAGVIIAASAVLLGGIVYPIRHGEAAPDYRVFVGEPADLRGVSGIIADTRALSGRGIIQLGLLILVATPLARVIFSVVAFALQRDRTYVVITLIVLAVLAYSLFGEMPL